MNTHARTSPRDWSATAKSALNNAGRFWFLVAAIGQLLFFAYIVVFYGAQPYEVILMRGAKCFRAG